ncbi:MAG: cell division protein FtsQ, partial [Deltaproteobacteria bacterium]|nr:cell division protein FtsQ [Deltaproteobacteria bacterium]
EWVEEIKPKVLELLTILDEGTTRLKLTELSEIHGDPYYGLTLVTLNDGVKIDIGNEDFREKLARLDKVLEIRKGLSSGIESIYLNSDRGVVVRSMPSSLKGERGVS